MMRVRGGFFCVFTLVVIVLAGSVMSVPPHKWFNEADIDLVSLTSLISSSLALCDDALNWSLMVNFSVDVNDSLNIVYDGYAVNSAMDVVDAIDAILFFEINDVVELEGSVGSYGYLQDMMVPLEIFVDNISLFVVNHQSILEGFSSLVNGSFGNLNGLSVQEVLANLRFLVSSARGHLRDAGEVLDSVSWVLVESFRTKIQDLVDILEGYDGFIEDFTGFFPDGSPLITIFVSDAEVFLFEEFDIFGYCMAGSRFLANESVWLYQDDEVLGIIVADGDGRYELTVSIGLNSIPGFHGFYARMRVDNVWYESRAIEVEIRRIPTFVEFEIFPHHVYLNETVKVLGRVVDHTGAGVDIAGYFKLDFDQFDFLTDNGYFGFEYPVALGFGRYMGQIYVDETFLYEGVVSEERWVYVDTPTLLILHASRKNISVDDDVVLLGSLVSGVDDGPLGNKTVYILLGSSMVGSTVTNDFGGFQYVFSSDELGAGLYKFSARFISDDIQFRGSHSNPVEVNLGVSLYAFLPLIGIGVVAVLVVFIFWLFRDRLSQWFGGVVPQEILAVVADGSRPRLRFARRIGRSFRRISRGAQMTQDAVGDAVFAQYRMLLRFLVAEGVIVGPTDTHLDLQHRMHRQGFPGSAVDMVTETFEQAMYSPLPVTYEQLLVFDQSVFQLMTRAGV